MTSNEDSYVLKLGDEGGAEVSVEVDFALAYEVTLRDSDSGENVSISLDQWKRANDFIALLLEPSSEGGS